MDGLKQGERFDPIFTTKGHIKRLPYRRMTVRVRKLLLQCLSEMMMSGTRRSREESRLYWEVNSVGHAGWREREESTVTPRFLAEVGEWRLVPLTQRRPGSGHGKCR